MKKKTETGWGRILEENNIVIDDPVYNLYVAVCIKCVTDLMRSNVAERDKTTAREFLKRNGLEWYAEKAEEKKRKRK